MEISRNKRLIFIVLYHHTVQIISHINTGEGQEREGTGGTFKDWGLVATALPIWSHPLTCIPDTVTPPTMQSSP